MSKITISFRALHFRRKDLATNLGCDHKHCHRQRNSRRSERRSISWRNLKLLRRRRLPGLVRGSPARGAERRQLTLVVVPPPVFQRIVAVSRKCARASAADMSLVLATRHDPCEGSKTHAKPMQAASLTCMQFAYVNNPRKQSCPRRPKGSYFLRFALAG